MSGFLCSAACKGRRPKHFEGRSLVSRPTLIARLLSDRSVARFIVAPTGFGKSCLAAEYAEVVFAFRHTFWVNAASPCFLRDLDTSNMATLIGKVDAAPSLVVFDEVPQMDSERADAFSSAIDELLSAGNEVVVTCVPSCDAYAERHRDRIKLSARHLLLNDDEASALQPADDASVAARIPCVAWGPDDGSAFLRGIAADEPSASMLLTAFLMLAFGSGTPADIRPYLSDGAAREAFERAEEDYPFLGVNARESSFLAAPIDAALLSSAFARKADAMAARSTCENANSLAVRLANDLLGRGLGSRACAVMRFLAKKPSCTAWLAERGADLTRAGCLKAAHELFVFVDKRYGPHRIPLIADEALRLLILDDSRSAAFLAESIASSRGVDPALQARMVGILVLAGSDDAKLRKASRGPLSEAGRARLAGVEDGGGALPDRCDDGVLHEQALGVAIASGQAALVAQCERFACLNASDDAACAGALLCLNRLARASSEEGPDGAGLLARDAAPSGSVEVIGAWAHRIACSAADDASRADAALPVALREPSRGRARFSPSSWIALRVACALSRAVECGALPRRYMPPEQVVSYAHQVEVALFGQQAGYRRDSLREERAASLRASAERNRYAALSPARLEAASSRVPKLYVGLFGGLDVRIGGVPVDAAKFSRQKTKTMLALLVLNRGREISRSRLLETLWPHLAHDAAQKSFYTIWSQLRHALEFEGSCPYLVRDQCGVRINAHLLESDVADFDAMCRSLSFGRVDAEGWQAHLAAVGDDFSQELLPSETDNDYIASMRRRFRSDLVDALVAASTRLSEAGEPRAALWFAREAVRRDGGREDAYAVLMQAQIDAGQRAAAIDTYFTCRRYLADELGIDPSTALVALYRSVIEAVEEIG